MKTFFIDNHGCAKNQVDAEELATRLASAGWKAAANFDDAGLIIVNTCGFIEEAKKESLEAVLAIKSAWPDKKVLAAGCLSERYTSALEQDLPEADGIFGNGDLSKIADVANEIMDNKRPVYKPPRLPYNPARRKSFFGFPRSVYLKISEGCSNRCSFCAIPLIRGDLSSRSPEDASREFSELVSAGAYEVCLIGQDLGSYGLDLHKKELLPELLASISAMPGDWRLRMLYIHPERFPKKILDIAARDARILPYFDLPFQHASKKILKAMNRSGDKAAYLELLKEIRSSLPAAVIRSTFLTGFPGETEEDFRELMAFQESAQLDWLGAFAYSREEDTPAYNIKNRVSKKLANARKKEVEEAQRPITEKFLERFVGTKQTVLVEETIDGEDLAIARGYMNAPEVDGSIVVLGKGLAAGQVLDVKIRSVRGMDMEALAIG
ncbi:30S ribosomal protein S12 methylthiotransferase RimO [Spirochaetota bacterium]